MKRILLALAFLVSGLAYGQDIDKICGYDFKDITANLKAVGSSFSYKGSDILTQLQGGFFDGGTAAHGSYYEIKESAKMCILLHELTGLGNAYKKATGGDQTALASDIKSVADEILRRYGPYNTSHTVIADTTQLVADIESGDAFTIIDDGFQLHTAYITTRGLPAYFKTYDTVSYNKWVTDHPGVTFDDSKARKLLSDQIQKAVEGKVIEKIIEKNTTPSPDQLLAEGNHLYDTKMKKVKALAGVITSKKSCTEITALDAYVTGKIVPGSSGVTLFVDEANGDGKVVTTLKANAADYANDIYGANSYIVAGKETDMDAVAKAIAASDPTFKGVTKWSELTIKMASLKIACDKVKPSSNNGGGSGDVDDIIKAGKETTGTWFKNWALCNNSLVNRDGLTNIQTCQQVILEGSYDPDTEAASYGLKDGNQIEELAGGIINQLDYYLNAVVKVKAERKTVDQTKTDLDADPTTKDSRGSSTNGQVWTDYDNSLADITKAETAIANMKAYLLNDFYNGDEIKNICFGFPSATAAATNGTKAIITDLSKAATETATIDFFKDSKVINVNAGKRSIQQLCVIFNRIKKASVSDYTAYKTFAGDIVDVLELNPDIEVKTTVSGVEVTGKDAFEVLFADAMVAKDDEAIIRLLSCLNGFGDIHTAYELGATSDDYTLSDAVTDIIKDSSRAGEATTVPDKGTGTGDNGTGTGDNGTGTGDNGTGTTITISDDLLKYIKAFVVIGIEADQTTFTTALNNLSGQFVTDKTAGKITDDNFKAELIKILTEVITANDAYWSTDKDATTHKTDLDDVIKDAFAMPVKTADAVYAALLTAMNDDTAVSQATKDRLGDYTGPTGANTDITYNSEEFKLIGIVKFAYDTIISKKVSTDGTVKPRRIMTPTSGPTSTVRRIMTKTSGAVTKTTGTTSKVSTAKTSTTNNTTAKTSTTNSGTVKPSRTMTKK